MFTIYMILLFVGILAIILIAQLIAYRQLNHLKKRLDEELNKTTKTEELSKKFLQKEKRIKFIKNTVMIMPVLAVGIYFITKESTGRESLVMVIHENEKYIYHSDYPYLLRNIEKGEYPNTDFYSKVKVYLIGGKIYIEPMELKHFAKLLAGELVFMDFKTDHHKGFVAASGPTDYFRMTHRTIPTEKLGELEKEYTIAIEHNNQSIEVVWSEGEKTHSYRAIRNSSVHEVYVVTGKYGTSNDQVLVNITDLIAHLDAEITITYDKKNKLLVWKSS